MLEYTCERNVFGPCFISLDSTAPEDSVYGLEDVIRDGEVWTPFIPEQLLLERKLRTHCQNDYDSSHSRFCRIRRWKGDVMISTPYQYHVTWTCRAILNGVAKATGGVMPSMTAVEAIWQYVQRVEMLEGEESVRGRTQLTYGLVRGRVERDRQDAAFSIWAKGWICDAQTGCCNVNSLENVFRVWQNNTH